MEYKPGFIAQQRTVLMWQTHETELILHRQSSNHCKQSCSHPSHSLEKDHWTVCAAFSSLDSPHLTDQ